MMLFVTAAVFFFIGLKAAAREDDLPLERICYAAAGGFALWLASTWLLALGHVYSRPGLLIRLLVAAGVAIVLALRSPRAAAPSSGTRHTARRSTAELVLIAAFVPVAIWIAYILWRGAVLPPVSHDALSYHLPKSVLMLRAGGYEYFPFLIPAIRTLPVNYELLLGEVIAWTGSDNLTEWVSILFYAFFAIGCGAVAQRWWRTGAAATSAVVLCAAGIPVVLLHSGAHKNDLMIASFMVAAMVAAGRWLVADDRRALALAVMATACAIGTKPQAGALAIALAPFIAARFFAHRGRPAVRDLTLLAVFSVAAFFALGGVTYAVNYAHERSLLDAKEAGRKNVEIVPYGDWSNLWQGPWVLIAAPLTGTRFALPVPWSRAPWFWRRYEIYFSHLGAIFSLCAIAAPFALFWTRRVAAGAGRERIAITLASLGTLAVMLPVSFHPHGLYTISLPRYALFIVPVVFGWTVAPLMALLERRSLSAAVTLVAALSVVFSLNAIFYAQRDTFSPFAYAAWATRHPGTRVVPFDPNRAASVVDRAAGPHDTIAIDAGFGTWIQPAFGAGLQRPIEFIPPGSGPPVIGNEAKWVIVDRAYSAVWGHPDFHDLSQARQYLLRGQPAPEDVRTMDALLRDVRFEVVFYNRRMVQAVFRRR